MTDFDKAIEEAKNEALPFESWERLSGESFLAFAAFCAYRDLRAERNIRKAFEIAKKVKVKSEKQYGGWRNWAVQYRWKERAADYDRHIEKQKQIELRKTIEAQGEKHRAVTGKMLDVVQKKLDTMNPDDLTQSNLSEWVQTAIRSEREVAGLIAPNGKPEAKQGEFNFITDFQGC